MRYLTPLWLILALVAAPAAPAWAQDRGYDPDAPDEDYVWVDGAEGTAKEGSGEGHYRRRARPGMHWKPGHHNEAGHWMGGHWAPNEPRPDHSWVRGHRGPDGYWVTGHWRRSVHPGHAWVAAALIAGHWRHGHWRPVKVRAGHIWVSGHMGHHGAWVTGHWRPRVRAGHRWVAGSWRYGRRVHGHWAPSAVRAGKLWVPGYRGPKGRWINGRWRVRTRAGHHWRAGHRGPRGWVAGAWAAGKVRRAVRRHNQRYGHEADRSARRELVAHRPPLQSQPQAV